MIGRRAFILALIASLPFFGAACTFNFGGSGDGGIFRSSDKGGAWEQISWIGLSGGGRRSFSNNDISTLVIDPRDSRTLIAGTHGYGLLASENSGSSWARIYSENVDVVSIATDPRSKCVLYFSTDKQVYKTSDCAKSWQVVFDETRSDVSLTSLSLDQKDPSTLYITNTGGEILRSATFGITWSVLYIIPDTSIVSLGIDARDHSLLYVATGTQGIFRSRNAGQDWEDISSGFEEISGGKNGRRLGTLSRGGALWYVSDGGIFMSESEGARWEEIPLLASAQDAEVLAFTVNPVNDGDIYYATQKTLYYSQDRGASWVTRPLPSSRAASVIVVDPYNSSNIYLGTQVYKQDLQLINL